MTDPKHEATIRRVRALLAKRDAEGTTQEEVAAAVGLAMKLLEKIGLSMAEVESEEEALEYETIDQGKQRIATWLCLLSQEVCQPLGCYSFKSGPSVVIVGTPENRAMARALYEYCKAAIQDLCKQYEGMGRVFLGNYRLGCIHAIRISIAKEKAAARDEYVSEGGALVVIEKRDDQLKRAESETKEKIKIRSTQARAQENAAAYSRGMEDGAGIYEGRHSRLGE